MRAAVSRNRRQFFFCASERPCRSGRPCRCGRRGAPRRRIKALAGVKHHVGDADCLVGPGDVVLRDERSSLWPGGGTTPEPPNARASPATWCFATKVQGFGRGKAPRRSRRMPGRARRRGAPRRRFKALAGVKHHVQSTKRPAGAGDVVLRDERSSLWPRGGTTSNLQNARPARATWCLATKVQGFGQGEAPRRSRRMPGRARRRGAPRRRIKALAGVKHHV